MSNSDISDSHQIRFSYTDYDRYLKRLWIPAFAGMTSDLINGF